MHELLDQVDRKREVVVAGNELDASCKRAIRREWRTCLTEVLR